LDIVIFSGRIQYLFGELIISIQTQLSKELVHAYKETIYEVTTIPAMVLKVGQTSSRLIALHEQHQAPSSAFITAWNPYSDRMSDEENTKRQDKLIASIKERELPYYLGEGKDPSGEWPGEASILILGISLDEAKELGNEWGQNAIIWTGADGVPQLILLK